MDAVWSPDCFIYAYRFAAQAHLGQRVSGGDLPYILHPTVVCMEVLAALRMEPAHDEILAVQAALLHDVLEDTAVTFGELVETFGDPVASGVLALTKDQRLSKDMQMADCLMRIQQQPVEIWMVKLADRITNLQPPPSFWTPEKIVRYQSEARGILAALGDASGILSARLRQKIQQFPI